MTGKLYLGPAEDESSFPLSATGLAAALTQRFPDVQLVDYGNPINGHGILRFQAEVAGMSRHGTFNSEGYLALSDGTPEDWAETIAWYLTLLPRGTVLFGLVEESPTGPTPLPADVSTPEQIAAFFRAIE